MASSRFVCLIALAMTTAGCERERTSEPVVEYPQYLGVRLTGDAHDIGARNDTTANRARCGWPAELPFLGNDRFCVPITRELVAVFPDVDERRWAIARGFREIREVVLGGLPEAPGRRLAVEVVLDTLNVPATSEVLETYLDDLLAVAAQERMPLLVNLDTVNWMNARPDVWGDPINIEGTFDEDAWVTWRNWGRQIRVGTPAPNLAGPGFRAANAAAARGLLPRLAGFYARLAPEDRYLYAGLVFGTEISVGVNHFHYPGGNALLSSTREECDPGRPRRADCPGPPPDGGPCAEYNGNLCPPRCDGTSTDLRVAQIGYKAARTRGYLVAGQPMTREVLDLIVADYVAYLGDLAREAGVPTHKITAHIGGICGLGGPHRVGAGRSGAVVPGVSLYLEDALHPGRLLSDLEASAEARRLPWASPEWLAFHPGDRSSSASWSSAIESTAAYLNNRMVILANWEGDQGIASDPGAIAGLRRALTAPPAGFCQVTPTLYLGHSTLRDGSGKSIGVELKTSRNPSSQETHLLASTRPDLDDRGILAAADVANARIEPGASFTLSRIPRGTVYVQLVTDGCGGAKRIQSPVVALELTLGSM